MWNKGDSFDNFCWLQMARIRNRFYKQAERRRNRRSRPRDDEGLERITAWQDVEVITKGHCRTHATGRSGRYGWY